jgi:hypothetical protein
MLTFPCLLVLEHPAAAEAPQDHSPLCAVTTANGEHKEASPTPSLSNHQLCY